MESQIEIMKELLYGLYEEVEEKRSLVRKTGQVSSDLCDICEYKQWEVVSFTPQEEKTLEKFLEWVLEFKIFSIESDRALPYRYEIKSKKRIIKGSGIDPVENIFKYNWNPHYSRAKIAQEIRKINGLRELLLNYSVSFCPHFNQDNKNAIKRKRLSSRFKSDSILIGCEECTKLKTQCSHVYKDGFLYSFRCPFRHLILKRRIDKMGLSYETGERDRSNTIEYLSEYGFYDIRNYYFKDIDILLNVDRIDNSEIIKHLNPSLIVTLSYHTNLPDFLKYDKNVLFYDEGGFYFYDKEKNVESDISVICETIITDLNRVMSGITGNDHDRTLKH